MAKNGYTRKIHTGFSFPNITESVLSVKFLPFQLMDQFLFGNITAYPFNQKPYVFYQNTQVTEERFCCKREHDKQSNTNCGHTTHSKQLIQEYSTENHPHNTSDEYRQADTVHRLTDLIQDHESNNRQKHRSCRCDIL